MILKRRAKYTPIRLEITELYTKKKALKKKHQDIYTDLKFQFRLRKKNVIISYNKSCVYI